MCFTANVSDMSQQQSMFYIQSTNGQHGILNLASNGFISAPYQNQLVNSNTPPTQNPRNYPVVFNQPLPAVQQHQAIVGPQQALTLPQQPTSNSQYSSADYYNLSTTNNQMVCNGTAMVKTSPSITTPATVPNGNHLPSTSNNAGPSCKYYCQNN